MIYKHPGPLSDASVQNEKNPHGFQRYATERQNEDWRHIPHITSSGSGYKLISASISGNDILALHNLILCHLKYISVRFPQEWQE